MIMFQAWIMIMLSSLDNGMHEPRLSQDGQNLGPRPTPQSPLATARAKGVSEVKKGWLRLATMPLTQAAVEDSPRWMI